MTTNERWELRVARDGRPIAELSGYPSEEQIEDLITANPATIREGVRLIARQPAIPSGRPDLLGVDQDGRLVIFELKAMSSDRSVFAQAIDYASWFYKAEHSDVADAVEGNPERAHIPRIHDFEAWYRAAFAGQGLDKLVPARIVIVSVGTDPASARIATFLSEHGIETDVIDLELTRRSSKSTKLNTDTAPSQESVRRRKRSASKQSANEQKLIAHATEYGSFELLSAANVAIRTSLPDSSIQIFTGKHAGYLYRLPDVSSGNLVGYVGIYLDPNQPRHILIYPFQKMRDLIDTTALNDLRRFLTVYQEKRLFTHGAFRYRSLAEWEEHGPQLCRAIDQMLAAWHRRRNEGR